MGRTERLLVTGGVWMAAFAATGCQDNVATAFPPGLDPLEMVDKAAPPAPENGDPYPEKLSMVSGHTDPYDWVHARAYVHASPAMTWSAIHNVNVSIDPKISKATYDLGIEPQYEFSYVIHYEEDDVLTVHFDVTWRHGMAQGTDEAPMLTASRFQKTWGSTFINLLEGSVVVKRVDDNTAELQFIEHLDATAAGADTIEEWYRNYYANILMFLGRIPPRS
jgi:hypothetical protein